MASEDPYSPFYGREYSEFEFTNTLYDHLIHPQWDQFGSNTLFSKILYADYDQGYCIIELMGEWNDTLYNDIMLLKRELLDPMLESGVNKYIVIGENVLNFHASDDSYYQEWFEDVEHGWIAFMNFRDHIMDEFDRESISQYLVDDGNLEEAAWRTQTPMQLFDSIDTYVGNVAV